MKYVNKIFDKPGSQVGIQGVTKALNWTTSLVGNLNASKLESKIFPELFGSFCNGPIIWLWVGQPSESMEEKESYNNKKAYRKCENTWITW